jgi:broad-specificity NMP kinase
MLISCQSVLKLTLTIINMSDYEKMEWVHSQISELKNGVDVDLDTLHSFVEELRNKYYFNNNGQLKEEV